MHEMGIVSGILSASVESAKRENATRINEIRVRIGDLTEIVDEALYFAFEALTPGTLADGATLVVERVAARSVCAQCGTGFSHGRFDVECPECECFLCELVEGRELEITSIDIDVPEEGDGGEAP